MWVLIGTTMKQSVCGSDAALCQSTLTTCLIDSWPAFVIVLMISLFHVYVLSGFVSLQFFFLVTVIVLEVSPSISLYLYQS